MDGWFMSPRPKAIGLNSQPIPKIANREKAGLESILPSRPSPNPEKLIVTISVAPDPHS